MRHTFSTSLLLCVALAAGCRDSTGVGGDSRAPVLHLQAPAAGTDVTGDSVRVAGSAVDDRGIARLTYTLNGGEEQAVEAGGGPSVPFGFTARGTALGANQLTVHAYDAAGNRGSATVAFTVRDASPPTVRVESPGEGEWTGRDSVTITGTVTDDRRVTRLSWALDGGAEQAVEVTPGRTVSFRIAARGVGPGEHRLTVTAQDEAGTRGSATVAFTAGSADVRLTTPLSGTVQGSFAAPLFGYVDSPVPVARLTYSVNGGAERPFCHPPYKYGPTCLGYPQGRSTLTWEADSLPQGDVVVRVFAYDAQQRRIGADRVDFRVRVPVRYYRATPVRADAAKPLYATDLNERGQVTGVAGDWTQRTVFFWDAGRFTDSGARAETHPVPPLLSDSGTVAFMPPGAEGVCSRVFTWTPGEAPRQVTTSNGGCHTLSDVNGAGKLLLWDTNPVTVEGRSQRALTLHRGAVTLLHPNVQGLLLNDADQVVGASRPPHGYGYGAPYGWLSPEAFRPFGGTCAPKALNDRGDVLCTGGNGWVLTDGREIHLPRVGRSGSNQPVSINDRMQVVGGYTYYQSPTQHVAVRRLFLWDGGVAHSVEIREGDWQYLTPVKVNRAGTILARGVRTGSQTEETLLLTPES
ncbi:MAG TPA: Ig-like domain-containing protein [Longimicrobiaceae bacterium]|nr:Ig-like domain-containing protein [Longimicrobiaceae bacterium]